MVGVTVTKSGEVKANVAFDLVKALHREALGTADRGTVLASYVVEVRLLGPIEAIADGRSVTIASTKQKALLAILALEANRVVQSSRLIDALWGDRPPQTAQKALQVHVSQLRKALGEGAVMTRGAGYVLLLDEGGLDVRRFEDAISRGHEARAHGDSATAARHFADALAIWRGPALADVAGEPFAETEAPRLEERRLMCVEHRIDAELACGRHGDVVAELEGLVAHHPLRERFREQQMLALYRCGRQADALDAYRNARQTFMETLGIAPGPGLRLLEQQILNQDEVLTPPPRVTGRGAAATASRGRWNRRALALAGVLAVAGAGTAAVVELSRAPGGIDVVAGNAVALIDPETNEVTAQIPVGQTPSAVVAGNGAAWVLNLDDQTVTRIDAESRETRTIATGGTPTGIALVGGLAWIGSGSRDESRQYLGATIGELIAVDGSAATPRVRVSLPTRGAVATGTPPLQQLAYAGGAVWVIDARAAPVRVDPDSGRVTVVGSTEPLLAIAAGRDGELWALDLAGKALRLDPRTGATTAGIEIQATNIGGIAVGAGATWVTAPFDGTVWRVDGRDKLVTRTILLERGVRDVAVGAKAVWVANPLAGTVTRIDPETNEVVATIDVGNAPRGLAATEDAVWVTVTGTAGEAAHGSGSGARAVEGALPAGICGPVFRGREEPDLLVVSDFPLQGGLRFSTLQMAAAISFVLRKRGFRAGEFTVGYQSCDDSVAQTGIFDEQKCAENAQVYGRAAKVVGVIGPVNSGCTLAALPELGRAPGGPPAVVSPLNSLPGLTKPEPGAPEDLLDQLYPAGRNYVRVYPTDDFQMAALAEHAADRGARRVFLLDDGEPGYGGLMASYFVGAARRAGLELAGHESWDPRAQDFAPLARRVAAARPQAVVVSGLIDTKAPGVVRALRAALPEDVILLGPDGLTPLSLFAEQAGAAADGVLVTLAGLPPPGTPGFRPAPAAEAFLRDFAASGESEAEPSVLFAAQAAEVLLDAIARSSGTRASVIEQLFATRVEDGILGSFRFDANGDISTSWISIYSVDASKEGSTALMSVEGGRLVRVLAPDPELVAP